MSPLSNFNAAAVAAIEEIGDFLSGIRRGLEARTIIPAIEGLVRDIFYREVYTLEETYRVVNNFNEPLRDEVMLDIRRGGRAMYLKGSRGSIITMARYDALSAT